MASTNDIGTIGDDGVQLDENGNPVSHLDEDARRSLQDLLDGPKVRRVPSMRDQFFAAGGTTEEVPYKPEDSQPSGHIEDVKAQEEAGAKASDPKTANK